MCGFSWDTLGNVLANPLDPPNPADPFGSNIHVANNPVPAPGASSVGLGNAGTTASGDQRSTTGSTVTPATPANTNPYANGSAGTGLDNSGNPLNTGSYSSSDPKSYATWGGQIPLLQQLAGMQYAQGQTLPAYLSGYQSAAPGFANASTNALGQSILGSNFSGSLTDINSGLTGNANAQTAASNTALRQGNLTDVQNMSAAELQQLQQTNPQLYAQMAAQQGAAGQGLNPVNLGQLSQQATNPGATASTVGTNFYGAPVTSQSVQADGSNATLSALQGQATGSGVSPLLAQQNQLAQSQLALGGQLTPDQLRSVQQSSRAGYAARGLDATNASVTNEALQTQAAQQAMLQTRLNQAQAVQGQNQTALTNQQNFGLGVSNQGLGYSSLGLSGQQSNQAANLTAQQAQLNAYMQSQGLGLQAQQSNQANNLASQQLGSSNYFNTLGFNQNTALANAGLTAQQTQLNAGLQNQGFTQGQSVVGNYSTNALNPFSTTLSQNSQNVGLNNQLLNQGLVGSQSSNQALMSYLNPTNAYGQNYYDTGLNAITGKQISDANATAGETSAGITGGAALATTALELCCWVARAAYGADNPRWLAFRQWMLWRSPIWLHRIYMKHGAKVASWVDRNAWTKPIIRSLMNAQLGGT